MPIDDALNQLTPIKTNSHYIVLPRSSSYPELLVSKEIKYLGKNWYEAHEELKKEDSLMLPIRQFIDFLNLLKSGNVHDENGNDIKDQESKFILEDILNERNIFRAEWLNAMFKQRKKMLEIVKQGEASTHFKDPYLIQNKTPGINLDYWLANATPHGLPPKYIPDGNLFYRHPLKNSVAEFGTISGAVFLDCGVKPQFSISKLGVRQAKIRSKYANR